nr:metalloregulator ArsR/SmtB family transcription factor [Mesorhizobium sp. NZP2298]
MSYVRKRLAEIKANPALRRRPATRLSVRNDAAYIARWLSTLGNDKRLLMLVHLIDGEKTVGELGRRIGISASATSQHLALLTGQGIVESRVDGPRRYYSCKSEAAKGVFRLLDDLAKTDRLPDLLPGPPTRP